MQKSYFSILPMPLKRVLRTVTPRKPSQQWYYTLYRTYYSVGNNKAEQARLSLRTLSLYELWISASPCKMRSKDAYCTAGIYCTFYEVLYGFGK